tara:strand:+ start:1683 stop:2117 length:435 start_codon:yes stop_codon:yes gene_type:complete
MYVITEYANAIGFGEPIFNLDYPIAQQGDWKIIYSDFAMNYKKLYALCYKNQFIKYFNTMDEAEKGMIIEDIKLHIDERDTPFLKEIEHTHYTAFESMDYTAIIYLTTSQVKLMPLCRHIKYISIVDKTVNTPYGRIYLLKHTW